MKGVLLAAGRGTRMGALTANTPKPLLPLCGQPIIERIVRGFASAGVEEIVLVTGYRGEQIEAALGDGARLGVRLQYRRQTETNGTARALLLARDAVGDEPFLLSWGDVVIDFDQYAAIAGAFAERPCDLLLSLNPMDDPWRGAAVYVDGDHRVTRLIEKPPPGTSTTRWNNAGIFVHTALSFTYAERLAPSERGEYELPQAISAMIEDGRRVHAYPLQGFWSDLGTPEDLVAAEAALRGEPGQGRGDALR